jgi:hypothetical protein
VHRRPKSFPSTPLHAGFYCVSCCRRQRHEGVLYFVLVSGIIIQFSPSFSPANSVVCKRSKLYTQSPPSVFSLETVRDVGIWSLAPFPFCSFHPISEVSLIALFLFSYFPVNTKLTIILTAVISQGTLARTRSPARQATQLKEMAQEKTMRPLSRTGNWIAKKSLVTPEALYGT